MVTAGKPSAAEITEVLETYFEWLLIDPAGRTFPLRNDEIEITDGERKVLFGFVGDKGFREWRLRSFERDGAEILLELSAGLGRDAGEFRMVPRTPAGELSREIVAARLEKANLIAAAMAELLAGNKLKRVSLNAGNGRLAEISLTDKYGACTVVIADVTLQLTHESVLASAMVQLEKLKLRRKDPVKSIVIAAEKTQARNLRKLHALLRRPENITIAELTAADEKFTARQMRPLRISELWRAPSAKLRIPSELLPGRISRRIIEMSPEKIDVIFSRQGETLRFLGLPFVRVRTLMGTERAWFGVGTEKRPLTDETEGSLVSLIEDLERYRRPDTPAKTHEIYRLAPEAWLGAILRRNIRLLDPNLILSPIYNQFRALNDKIDLLAIRRDGRLVIIELKTSPDRGLILQAADYWRKIELQRRRGELARARLFGEMEIIDKPALVYTAAPALSFHRNHEFFARSITPEMEIWRFELHEHWRKAVRVINRRSFDRE